MALFFFLPPPTASGQHREVHPYGPSSSGFNTDLVVEIDPLAISSSPVLATVKGMVFVVPDPGSATTCTLILRGSSMRDEDVVLQGLGANVYRNIDKASVGARVSPIIEQRGSPGFLDSMTLEARVDAFLAGSFGVFVSAGTELGLASTENGAGGWGRVGFEIVLLPGGLGMPGGVRAGSAEGWARLLELVALGSTTRRLDPLGLYAVPEVAALLHPTHVNHPLFTFLTRQVLIEIRDEYDRPLAGSIDVLDSRTGTTTTHDIDAAFRGMILLDSIPSGGTGTPSSGDFTVSSTNHVFTDLPAGGSAEAAPTLTLSPPAQWALQRIFMADVEDGASWFVENTTLPRFTSGNKVTPLVDGIATYAEFASALRTLTAPEHRMYLAAYDLYDSFELVFDDASSTFSALTTAAANAGADIYALAWDRLLLANFLEVGRINALPNSHGHAILDGATLTGGSQHQKLMVIDGNQGAFAFCGGIDIRPNRLDSPNHGAPSAYHDVHARVDGPAVGDLHLTFVERWNSHPSRPGPLLSTAPPPFKANAGTSFVQIARTYAPELARAPGTPISFVAPDGDLTCRNALIRAIGKARKFIYIEDQFLFPYPDEGDPDTVGILDALLDALPRIDYLIMVVSHHLAVFQGRSHQKDFIEALQTAFPDKVHVFYPTRALAKPKAKKGEVAADWCEYILTVNRVDNCSGEGSYRSEIYCHSKVWMVDDIIFKIGSANCNRRSLTHDSEADVVVVDGAVNNGVRHEALKFRLELWGEHLDMSRRPWLLEDHKHALYYWLNRSARTRVAPYDMSEPDLVVLIPPLPWSITDPDGT